MPARPFHAQSDGFDLNNALILATASNLAYESDRRKIRSAMRRFGFRRVHLIEKEGTELLVARSDEAIVAAFRGTERNLTDWGTDAQFILTGGPLGMVHEGFAEALGLVWQQVVRKIDSFQDAGQGIWFCGHSLGGAIATLATAKCLERARPVRGLYTFGSPRVGDRGFAGGFDQRFHARSFRFVNNNDIVTRVPTRSMGYRHVGQVRYFAKNGDLDSDMNAWARFVDRVGGRFDAVFKKGLDGISDHSMATYEKLVGDALSKQEANS